jgi:magnesium-transporting ATPase (P-type)
MQISTDSGSVGRGAHLSGRRRVVESFRRNGRYVAMVGDGVNDVPALKASRLSIAQGSGAQMARPSPTSCSSAATSRRSCHGLRGRRILRNIQR